MDNSRYRCVRSCTGIPQDGNKRMYDQPPPTNPKQDNKNRWSKQQPEEDENVTDDEENDTDDCDDQQEDGLCLLFASLCRKIRHLPRKLQYRVQKEMFHSVLRAEEETESENPQNNRNQYPPQNYCCPHLTQSRNSTGGIPYPPKQLNYAPSPNYPPPQANYRQSGSICPPDNQYPPPGQYQPYPVQPQQQPMYQDYPTSATPVTSLGPQSGYHPPSVAPQCCNPCPPPMRPPPSCCDPCGGMTSHRTDTATEPGQNYMSNMP